MNCRRMSVQDMIELNLHHDETASQDSDRKPGKDVKPLACEEHLGKHIIKVYGGYEILFCTECNKGLHIIR